MNLDIKTNEKGNLSIGGADAIENLQKNITLLFTL